MTSLVLHCFKSHIAIECELFGNKTNGKGGRCQEIKLFFKNLCNYRSVPWDGWRSLPISLLPDNTRFFNSIPDPQEHCLEDPLPGHSRFWSSMGKTYYLHYKLYHLYKENCGDENVTLTTKNKLPVNSAWLAQHWINLLAAAPCARQLV